MSKVRIGLVGYGGMGVKHARYLTAGVVPNGQLTAICDTHPDNLARARDVCGDSVNLFDSAEKCFASGTIDAALIATPHYYHPPLAIQAFEHGLHVLIEKPAGVHTKHVRQMNAVAAQSGKVFAIMCDQRTWPIHQKLRDLIALGELGELKRVSWIMTQWYRPQSYYDSAGWRATWAGEGGGVLINQCLHQLDLWQWMCGMPKRVRAFCGFGKYHDIEVEDDVTAYFEYGNGATGVLVTSTGEVPGTNRLEVSGDNGQIVMEDNSLTFWRTSVPERQFNRESKGRSGAPECCKCDVPVATVSLEEHHQITSNWVEAIVDGVPLVARGEEGIHSLELVNAMLLSAWTDNWFDLPIDDDVYYEELQSRIQASSFKVIRAD